MTEWHRIFGLALTDLFTNSNYQVELEKDVSTQQQFEEIEAYLLKLKSQASH